MWVLRLKFIFFMLIRQVFHQLANSAAQISGLKKEVSTGRDGHLIEKEGRRARGEKGERGWG